MSTYHLHIRGRVQGVGFRPAIYKAAKEEGLAGWVRNDTDGVHIEFNCADQHEANEITRKLLQRIPPIALVEDFSISPGVSADHSEFAIVPSHESHDVRLLLTPDLGICPSCAREMTDPANRRHQYPFITCTQCGPRFSITRQLPYDRPNTTMVDFVMCPECEREYRDILDDRHYSQTNSCGECPVQLSFTTKDKKLLARDPVQVRDLFQEALLKGKIIAVKGIGGYLLMADATNPATIDILRKRKKRPAKPFALMYPDVETARLDLRLDDKALSLAADPVNPILLVPKRTNPATSTVFDMVAPGLDQVGFMLPYTGLYKLLLDGWQKPVIATSGNVTNSPIIFSDQEVYKELDEIADYFLLNDREIVVPQDDSVVRYDPDTGRSVILRRSRGLAPSLENFMFGNWAKSVFASGADMKSSFGIVANKAVYISQYLGNLEYLTSQESYRHTCGHFAHLLNYSPELVICDSHPGYYSTHYATEVAQNSGLEQLKVQHHLAHFSAVLAENQLVDSTEPVLGVILDGTGYGSDGNIWGGEFFVYDQYQFSRIGHLRYFDHLLQDKMPREPRISAFSLFKGIPSAQNLLRQKFNASEWHIYNSLPNSQLKTSSTGRLFDGIASILGLLDLQTYEGEAAMKLEQLAISYRNRASETDRPYPYTIGSDGSVDYGPMLDEIVSEHLRKMDAARIAYRFHLTLADMIRSMAEIQNCSRIAISGGVAQNLLLIDLCRRSLPKEKHLYLHKELSPNDECIAFGQLVYAFIDDIKNKY